MKRAADDVIDLIFNTTSSLQNDSMKQLSSSSLYPVGDKRKGKGLTD